MPETMRAVVYTRTGPAAEVLEMREVPRPTPAPGEVLVRIAVSGANPSDAKTRAGARGPVAFSMIIPHSDGAGRVVAVGEGVDRARIGQRVWLWNAAFGRAFGTCADYIALPSAQAVTLPDTASYAAGACLGIPALTAHRCLSADGPVTGLDVLVTGGAGSVGAYAVQMARLGGARSVVATVSGPGKAAHATEMGASHVVNYRQGDAAKAILAATGGRGVDRIVEVEFGGNLEITRAVLKENGTIAAYGSMAVPEPVLPFYPMMFAGQTLRMVLVYKLPEAPRRAGEADLSDWLAEGALQHLVAAEFRPEDTAKAHDLTVSSDRIGAVLVRFAQDNEV